MCGFLDDLRQASSTVKKALSKNPLLKVAILSEEPLWDTLWGGDFLRKHQQSYLTGFPFDFIYLNHRTTSIFNFKFIPYFITTCDNYYLRYSSLFKKNLGLSASEIKSVWASAGYRQAFFAEKRVGSNFEINSDVSDDIVGLCSYRSEIAEFASGNGILRVGQGWGEMPKRQSLPDWHLDKISTLNRQSFIVSALENTHLQDYLTEKIFDAFAVLGVPVYYAGPTHAVHRLLPEGGFINVYGLTPAAAAKKISEFDPSDEFMCAYLVAQQRLSDIFSSPRTYWSEREFVLDAIVSELNNIRLGL